jgi:hypothetical protein
MKVGGAGKDSRRRGTLLIVADDEEKVKKCKQR